MHEAARRAARIWEHEGGPVLVLVRHGRTEWNATRRFLGRTDVPLDDVGRTQAATLAERLPGPLHAAWTSPLRRALDTARAVYPDARVHDDLAELDQGELEGLDGPTAFARFPAFFDAWKADPGSAVVPGGERLADLHARAEAVLHQIADAHAPGQVVGVFTHQMVISTLTCRALDRPLGEWRAHRVGNAALSAFVREETGWRVLLSDVRLAPDPDEVSDA